MLGGALNVGVTPIEAKEILHHAVPYVGMARVFDFIHATNEVLTSRGIKLPLEGRRHPLRRDSQKGWNCRSRSSET
jgi:4-carboxymuconolactone decarboxylase